MKKLPKFLFAPLFSFIFFLSLFLLARPTHAQCATPAPAPSEGGAAFIGWINGCIIARTSPGFDDKAFNLNQLYGTVDSINHTISGRSVLHPEINTVSGSAIGFIGQAIAVLYTQPASSVEYLAYLQGNLGLSGPVFAQQTGTGFQGLTPFLSIWRAFRNAAYLFFIFIFAVTGLLVMFRIKISPQAVATIQNTMPRMVIVLILITLSYALVGLMVDLMYVLMFLIASIFDGAGVAGASGALPGWMNRNIMSLFWEIPTLGVGGALWTPAVAVFNLVSQLLGFLGGGFAFFVALAIFLLAILVALFRIFFILLRAYIWVLILLIFSPFSILFGSLPGGGGFGLGGWMRAVIANLAVFPATLTMFLTASLLLQRTDPGANPVAAEGWVGPFLGIGGGSMNMVSPLIGLGLILVTPAVAQMVNDALKPPPFPYGTAIGSALGAGPAVAGGLARRTSRILEPVPGPGGSYRRRGVWGIFG